MSEDKKLHQEKVLTERISRLSSDLIRYADAMETGHSTAKYDYRLTLVGLFEAKIELKKLRGQEITEKDKQLLEKAENLTFCTNC